MVKIWLYFDKHNCIWVKYSSFIRLAKKARQIFTIVQASEPIFQARESALSKLCALCLSSAIQGNHVERTYDPRPILLATPKFPCQNQEKNQSWIWPPSDITKSRTYHPLWMSTNIQPKFSFKALPIWAQRLHHTVKLPIEGKHREKKKRAKTWASFSEIEGKLRASKRK